MKSRRLMMTLCSLLCVGVLALDAAPKSSPKVKKKKKGSDEDGKRFLG